MDLIAPADLLALPIVGLCFHYGSRLPTRVLRRSFRPSLRYHLFDLLRQSRPGYRIFFSAFVPE